MSKISTERLSADYIHANLMGPDAVMMCVELCDEAERAGVLDLGADARVCDLGCGMGVTSMYLADRFPAHVWACDLWNTAEDNGARFGSMGFGSQITAVQADALELPADICPFDALTCIDSYNYFGRSEGVIDKVAAYVKPGGTIMLAIAALREPLDDEQMKVFGLSWTAEQMEYIQTLGWWRDLLAKSDAVVIDAMWHMDCYRDAWTEWLTCDNEYAQGDRAAMEAGGYDLMTLIGVRLTVR